MKKKFLLSILSFVFLTIGLVSCDNNEQPSSSDTSYNSISIQERCYVTFVNYDASVLFYTSVEYGGTAVYQGDTPSRPSSEQYNYKFIGWDTSLTNITSDLTVIAQFEQALNRYEVKFVNDDGTPLYNAEVVYGDSATYVGDTPTKSTDKNYIYTFAGWDKSLDNITENTTFTATYTTVDNIKGISSDGLVEILNTYDNNMIVEEILKQQLCVELKEEVAEVGNAKYLDLDISMFDNALTELDLSLMGEQQITINYLGFTSKLSIHVYEDLAELEYIRYKGKDAWYGHSYDSQILNIYLYENNIATIGSPNSFIRKEYSFLDNDSIKINNFIYDIYQENQWEYYITNHIFDEPLYKTYIMEPYDGFGGVQIDLYSDDNEGYCHYSFKESDYRTFTITCTYIIEENIIRIPDFYGCVFEILDNNQLKVYIENQ